MSDHQCFGLYSCVDHPKWAVTYRHGLWFTFAPHSCLTAGHFRTWREAYDYAYAHATGAAQ